MQKQRLAVADFYASWLIILLFIKYLAAGASRYTRSWPGGVKGETHCHTVTQSSCKILLAPQHVTLTPEYCNNAFEVYGKITWTPRK